MDRHSSSTACSSSSSPSSSIIRTYQCMDHQWQVYYNYTQIQQRKAVEDEPIPPAVSCPFHALIRLNASAS
ncbi:hypothetical protein GE21DRAFT_1266222 [Neurospora crassa]|nr:hypothetical protein GE21DRAFT_1266222 [Neurospora crassa]